MAFAFKNLKKINFEAADPVQFVSSRLEHLQTWLGHTAQRWDDSRRSPTE